MIDYISRNNGKQLVSKQHTVMINLVLELPHTLHRRVTGLLKIIIIVAVKN